MAFPWPADGVSSGLAPFAGIAVTMIAVTIVVLGLVLRSERGPPLVTQMLLALTVLLGGTILLLALLFVFLDTDGTTAWTWVLVAFNFMMMVPLGLWFVTLIVFRDRRVAPRSWRWPLGLAVAATGSEALMGVLFAIGGAAGPVGSASTYGAGLASVWFFWSMAAVMASLTVWAPQPASGRAGAVALTAAAVVAPWVTAFPAVGVVAMSAVMVGWFAFLYRLLRLRQFAAGEASPAVGVSVAFLAMTAAGAVVGATADVAVAAIGFGTVMGFAMAGEMAYLVRACYADPASLAWPGRAPVRTPRGPSAAPVPVPVRKPRP